MDNVEPSKAAWRAPSLRGRVGLLAGVVVVLLSITLLLLVWLLRSSQANLVARSNKHLEAVVGSLVDAYQTRSDRNAPLLEIGLSPRQPAARKGPLPPP